MASFAHDLRYAFRLLLKTPVITCVAVLSLALGIGANTAIFGVMNALMLRSLPVRNPQQLVSIEAVDPRYPKPFAVYQPLLQEPHANWPKCIVRTRINPLSVEHSAERALASLGHQYSLRTQTF
ncbi:MAG TPA: hypothetical protein VF283_08450 [Bryobacteraceae bacterium]